MRAPRKGLLNTAARLVIFRCPCHNALSEKHTEGEAHEHSMVSLVNTHKGEIHDIPFRTWNMPETASIRMTHPSSSVAPYCAIPRDHLSDTPLLRAMGFLVSQRGQLGAIPPPPFLSVSPLESMRSGGAIPPTKGVSQQYLRDTYETRQNVCDAPLCDTISKGFWAIWGVSRTGPLSLRLPVECL